MTVFKEGKECDFVLDDKVALQVCFDPTNPSTLHREIEGLKETCQYFGLKVGYIVEPETIFSLL